MDMTGKSQDEVVVILRSTKRGSTVNLCVSRLDASGSSSTLPRQMVRSFLAHLDMFFISHTFMLYQYSTC